MDSLDAKLNRCAITALETVLDNSTEEIQEIYSTDEAVEETITKAFESLLSVCPRIRKFVLEERRATYYSESDSEEANKFYETGNDLLGKEDFKGALKSYSKAIKKDPEFIYAIDNKALTYRMSGDTKNAIKYYLISLKIYPEGSFALQNIAAACTILKDYQSALDYYDKLTYYYPADPEGYFGIGKVFVLMEDFEKAIDYVFIAHKIYSIQESEYIKDSTELALVIFNRFKEMNKTELFFEKAREYGIAVNND
jgi:tetratricopeptide (TPR) repeat protein